MNNEKLKKKVLRELDRLTEYLDLEEKAFIQQ
jgi:hypothetical protein